MNIPTYIEPERSQWESLTQRAMEDDPDITEQVKAILEAVRSGGDSALLDFGKRFDGYDTGGKPAAEALRVGEDEIQAASESVPQELKDAIVRACSNIRKFHEAQLPPPVRVETSPGVVCTRKAVPIRRIGLYIPGGRAPLFSTVLMLAVPARVAGCRDVILCTPPGKNGKANPAIIHAASLCGVRDLFKIGGAQAIAAMACGTQTVPRRDKIFGPGNRFVVEAKRQVGLSEVAIDMPAGPSEVMILADGSAVPAFVAADFLSQAEHGPDSQSMLVCTSEDIAEAVVSEVARQALNLPRWGIIRKSLNRSRIIIFQDRKDIIDFANEYAPEHLIVSMRDPGEVADGIYAAGSLFLGNCSPESAGDYASGTNHTLPTGGWARSFSALGLDAYLRRQTCQELSEEGLRGLADTIRTMARAEGLDAHAAAVEVRIEQKRP